MYITNFVYSQIKNNFIIPKELDGYEIIGRYLTEYPILGDALYKDDLICKYCNSYDIKLYEIIKNCKMKIECSNFGNYSILVANESVI